MLRSLLRDGADGEAFFRLCFRPLAKQKFPEKIMPSPGVSANEQVALSYLLQTRRAHHLLPIFFTPSLIACLPEDARRNGANDAADSLPLPQAATVSERLQRCLLLQGKGAPCFPPKAPNRVSKSASVTCHIWRPRTTPQNGAPFSHPCTPDDLWSRWSYHYLHQAFCRPGARR